MKNLILSAIIMAFVLVSCNQKNKETETTNAPMMEQSSKKYSCPMHPEVQGKLNDKCSKCGMNLTEEVK
ncbi:MAG TPA: heavy metal-binding domain-containing protein [Flavobacterium sp.]